MMDDKTEHRTTVSFEFSKKNDTQPLKTRSVLNEEVRESECLDYVASVEGTNVTSVTTTSTTTSSASTKSTEKLVIPCIKQNNWRIKDLKKCSKSAIDNGQHAETNSSKASSDCLQSKAVEELLRLSNEQGQNDVEGESKTFEIPLLELNKPPLGTETDEHLDTDIRPNESTEADYEAVPIELFGQAILRGMGWKEGEGIGKNNKRRVALIDAVVRPKGMGLGADKSALLQNENKRDKPVKPGDKKIVEAILDFRKGVHCVIIKGQHADLYGIIQGIDADNCHCIIKLAISQQCITISQFNLKLVTTKEFEQYARYLNKGKSDRYKEKESKANGSHDINYLNSKRSHDESNNEYGVSHHDKKKAKHSPSGRNTSSWVHPLTRVKIIDKRYKDGRYYQHKVVVDDVLPNSVVCRTTTGRLLEGLTDSQLETVIPKDDNSHVLIVNGDYKCQIAEIIDRNRHKQQVSVQLLSDRDTVLKLHYDDVCEYIGNVDHLMDF